MNFSAPGSSVAAPPTPGGYPYRLVPGNGEYPYPLPPDYGGHPLPQMQPQEKTSMFKKFFKKLGAFFCGLVRAAATDAFLDYINDN